MARPEGYRKAVRLMELADKFLIPIIMFVDTAGAYPGIGAEERGQSEAIARCTQTCLNVTVPIISIIIGEGGSGGAVAIATANRVTMLEHSIYTVASPEASASILWRDSSKASEAANSMRITAQDLIEMKIIDGIVLEPSYMRHIHLASLKKIIGKVDPDENGIEGVEYYFNSNLEGKDGEIRYEASPNGKIYCRQSIIMTNMTVVGIYQPWALGNPTLAPNPIFTTWTALDESQRATLMDYDHMYLGVTIDRSQLPTSSTADAQDWLNVLKSDIMDDNYTSEGVELFYTDIVGGTITFLNIFPWTSQRR